MNKKHVLAMGLSGLIGAGLASAGFTLIGETQAATLAHYKYFVTCTPVNPDMSRCSKTLDGELVDNYYRTAVGNGHFEQSFYGD